MSQNYDANLCEHDAKTLVSAVYFMIQPVMGFDRFARTCS